MPECWCSEDTGPCETHCQVIVQREGASLRSADQLCILFIEDALEIQADVLSPVGRTVLNQARAALNDDGVMSAWIGDPDLSEALSDLVSQVESYLADLSVEWEDGYRIVKITGGPLKPHSGHVSRLSGAWWCDTCNSPLCELA